MLSYNAFFGLPPVPGLGPRLPIGLIPPIPLKTFAKLYKKGGGGLQKDRL